ncbi:uncharacterized protein CLAFUR5_07758 [Fulvia fulva]|uniref:Arrestin-like N-terminal domain-containing protein n=1 Tax=Passalora fulva TaxID=5499 RepID=A0A9Q8LDB4_PASFU|nr:uncharacterized protein CLAFUR5_07758 [Fulvia fulva]KAK4630043.1 hypothetical protein CLAFUR0_07635 [Fulvia fulva]UJO15311.1 hypothetical protein CLAFUR5_07758 [Fulvia fulva]
MKLGKLVAQVRIDGGSRPHFGSGDTITGHVILTYKPQTGLFKKNTATAPLFGPLKVAVILHGAVRIRVRRDREMPTSHGVQLFALAFPVYNESFKAEVEDEHRLPFTASFPDVPGAEVTPYSGGVSNALPPSFNQHFSDYADIVDVAVVYALGATVDMPGIDIKTSIPNVNPTSTILPFGLKNSMSPHDAPLVRYQIARPPKAFVDSGITSFTNQAKVQTEHLLPEDQRPSGFKQKAKAVFTSSHFPTFAVEITCTHPQHIFPGQQLSFEVALRRLDDETSASFFPEVTLEQFKAEIVAYTSVDTSQRRVGRGTCRDKHVVQTMTRHPGGPIDLSKGNDHTAVITTDPIRNHPSSFSHHTVSRQYNLRLFMQFKIANKGIRLNRECGIVMVPTPLDYSTATGWDAPPAEAGPSTATDSHEDELPTYEEARAGPSGSSGQNGSAQNGDDISRPTYEEAQAVDSKNALGPFT